MTRRKYTQYVSYADRPELKSALTRLLKSLEVNYRKMNWFYTRSCDILRCEAMHDNLRLLISHTVPNNHEDYRDSEVRGVTVGRCPEEFKLEITDLEGRFGYKNVVKHFFPADDELFQLVRHVFEVISEGHEFEFSSDKKSGPTREGAIVELSKFIAR